MKLAAAVPLLLALVIAGCSAQTGASPSADGTAAPTAAQEPAPSSSLPLASTPEPSPALVSDDVSFTFRCGYFAEDGTPTTISEELMSLEAAWAFEPATAWCEPVQHGTSFTTIQVEAVALAGDVLPGGIDQVGSLYAQCAMRANGYLALTSLASNQAQEVRAFLHLCPGRPGADQLRSMLD